MGFDSGRGFTSAGSPVGGQGEIGGTLPTGTEGQILYFDGTTSLWTATSNVYNDDINNRVGIGITSSLLAKLHVKSASGVTLQVDTSTINNNFTILDSGGLVGIGKTPNTYKLDIEGNGTVLRVRDNQGFGNLLQVNTTNIDLFDNQGNQVFTVRNTNGSTNIKGGSIILCQDGTNLSRGTQFGGEVQYITHSVHLALVTDTSSKDIIFGIGGANEKLRVKNTEIISQVPIAIAPTRDASAILQANSTTLGFLPPRMTTAQRDAIVTPAEGLVIYNTTTQVLNFYNGATWGAV